jgi:thymidylate synthase
MRIKAIIEGSRNGRVKTILEPVTLCTLEPTHRVLFVPQRKENPYFHFAECLWMMAGCRSVDWLSNINPRMAQYAEADGQIHGAYGWRWRNHFGFDQIRATVDLLLRQPNTRRAVIEMWDAPNDLNAEKNDLPCNTHIYFRKVGEYLDMTVCNRSNDLVWGALGSNIVHFSFLLEFIAHAVGLKVGCLYQVTNNLHVYERHWHFLDVPPQYHSYAELGVSPYKIIKGDFEVWLEECEDFVVGNRRQRFSEPLFTEVAAPLLDKAPDLCKAEDWKLACMNYDKRKANDG